MPEVQINYLGAGGGRDREGGRERKKREGEKEKGRWERGRNVS